MSIQPKTAAEAEQYFAEVPASDIRTFLHNGERRGSAKPFFASYVVSKALTKEANSGHYSNLRNALRIRGLLSSSPAETTDDVFVKLIVELPAQLQPAETIHSYVIDEDRDALLAAETAALLNGFAIVTNTSLLESGHLHVQDDAVAAYKPKELLKGIVYHGALPEQYHGIASQSELANYQTTDSFIVI